jgi:hypothetical protein
MAIDLTKLARILGMSGSAHDGEALNAVRMADRLIRDNKMTWEDLLAPSHQLEVATEACRQLIADLEELRAENARLRANGVGAIAPEWSNVGGGKTDHRVTAHWVIQLGDTGRVWLSDFERDFLDTALRWRGSLTPRQRPVFDRIVAKVAKQTGLQPP